MELSFSIIICDNPSFFAVTINSSIESTSYVGIILTVSGMLRLNDFPFSLSLRPAPRFSVRAGRQEGDQGPIGCHGGNTKDLIRDREEDYLWQK